MKTTKDRILEKGLDVLSRSGLAGVTLGVLAHQAGMSKSGLFAHFGSKEDVQLRLLAETARVAASTYVDKAMAKPPGMARLKTLFKGWLGWSEKAGLAGGCPIAAGMFELDDADVNNPVRQQLVSLEGEWRDLLAQFVQEAIDLGELGTNLDPKQFAWELCGI